MVALCIVGGGFVLLIAVGVVLGHRSPAQREADKVEAAKQKTRDDETERVKAVYEEKRKDDWRGQCKLKDTQPVFVLDDDDIRYRCQQLVRENLKAPSTADFPSKTEEGFREFKTDDGCHRTYNSYVESQNAFGVQIRTQYSCTFDPRSGDFTAHTK